MTPGAKTGGSERSKILDHAAILDRIFIRLSLLCDLGDSDDRPLCPFAGIPGVGDHRFEGILV